MKLWIGDWDRDTAHLTMTQSGALFALLKTYYAKEGPLPNDLQLLYRIAKAHDRREQDAVRVVVGEYFYAEADGLLHNKRADRQMPEDLRARDAARKNGRKGGRPRKDVPHETDGLTESKPTGSNPLNPIETHGQSSQRQRQQERKSQSCYGGGAGTGTTVASGVGVNGAA